jgi:hypothetical protein
LYEGGKQLQYRKTSAEKKKNGVVEFAQIECACPET